MTEHEDEFDELNDDDFNVDMDLHLFDDLNEDDDVDPIELPKKRKSNKKPKLIGKHSLAYDTIYKGKKDVSTDEEEEVQHIIKNAGGSLDINDDVIGDGELKSTVDYFRNTRLKREIKRLLTEFTDIDFHAPRRKPSKSDFNAYFQMLLMELHEYGYTKTEIFIELSGYFSDNIWNIFLLLDNKFSNVIIAELKDKYGIEDINKIDFI